MPITATTDEAFAAALKAALEERGADYVYPEDKRHVFVEGWSSQCLYFDIENPEEPLCFIGLALSKLGVTATDLQALSPKIKLSSGESGLSMGALGVMERLGFSSKVSWAAHEAQAEQDRGETWGRAFQVFCEEMGITAN